MSHVSLYDGTVEGLDLPDLRARSLQFHPEAGPGPHDAWPLLEAWVRRWPMPRRNDIESICIVGSGPIVIGQAAEFDYAGCQALKVLREDGFRTIVVNSNPATIMTDPGFADRTYLEPLDAESVAEVLRIERPDALLPTMGGQTALNLARELANAGVLDELGIELIGARLDAIERAEDRLKFKEAVESCGLKVPTSAIVTSLDELDGRRRCRPSSGPPSRSAATAAGSPTPRRSCAARSSAASRSPRSARCSSRSRCAAGTSSSSRSSATGSTTSSSSARSRTSTRWASTPATPSRSRRR